MRILIADSQPRVRSALRVLLEKHLRLAVSGEAGTADDVLRLASDTSPDLLLLDWDLPGLEPASLVQRMRVRCPAAKIIVMSGRAEARPAALAAGAHQFVSKGAPPEGLMAAVAATKEVEHGSEVPSAPLRSQDDTRAKPTGAVPE
jgi:two-component system response regulator DesR